MLFKGKQRCEILVGHHLISPCGYSTPDFQESSDFSSLEPIAQRKKSYCMWIRPAMLSWFKATLPVAHLRLPSPFGQKPSTIHVVETTTENKYAI